jgi:hypothetical protein
MLDQEFRHVNCPPRRKQKGQRGCKNTILHPNWALALLKDGEKLTAHVKACTIHRAQSFALCSP